MAWLFPIVDALSDDLCPKRFENEVIRAVCRCEYLE